MNVWLNCQIAFSTSFNNRSFFHKLHASIIHVKLPACLAFVGLTETSVSLSFSYIISTIDHHHPCSFASCHKHCYHIKPISSLVTFSLSMRKLSPSNKLSYRRRIYSAKKVSKEASNRQQLMLIFSLLSYMWIINIERNTEFLSNTFV